jgi:hypothetical protein
VSDKSNNNNNNNNKNPEISRLEDIQTPETKEFK